MSTIWPVLQLIFVVLVILPRFKAAQNEIKCYYCDKDCSRSVRITTCNETFPRGTIDPFSDHLKGNGVDEISSDPSQTSDSNINQFRELRNDDPFACFKYAYTYNTMNETNLDYFGKGCGRKSLCTTPTDHYDPKYTVLYEINFCNQAGSIKFKSAMILVPIAIIMFFRIYHLI
ncbi:uncharacterized protein [Prorops nasuta]|uniref:uncharacterized protein n=1 Tax=Prorops nasuta TaxID=863751 RepID=UPI0034CF7920